MLKKLFPQLLTIIILSACTPQTPTPSMSVDEAVSAFLTSQPAAIEQPTYTPYPTYTPAAPNLIGLSVNINSASGIPAM